MTATSPTRKISTSTDRVLAYAEDVLAGRIIAGPHVRNACRRHLHDLEHGHERGLYFDAEAAEYAFGFFEGVLKLSEGQFEGKPFELHPSQAFIVGSLFGWKRENGTRRFRRAYSEQGKGNGKALALDTPIPTPSGWTTMGELEAGDWVLSDDGRPCQVLEAHPVSSDWDCYELEFDDGSKVIASAEHLWVTEQRRFSSSQGAATKGKAKKDWGDWRNKVRTTAEIAESLTYPNGKYQSANHSVRLSGSLELPELELAVPPYVLGAWLGDGDSDCARITCAFTDSQIIEELERDGQPVTRQTRHSDTTGRWSLSSGRGSRGNTLHERLRELGVLGNKHVPTAYLRSSSSQRLALLQGLMDTDGTISESGQCEFTSSSSVLAEGVLELVVSMGLKAVLNTGEAKLNGRLIGPKYRVSFQAPWTFSVFRLERKRARQAPTHSRRRLSADRRIVACRQVARVPVRCITVSSSSSMFLCGRAMIPTHNSPMAGGIGLYGLSADGEAGAQVYAAAAKREQAGILFADAVKMVNQSPALKKRLQFSGGPGREYNIAYHRKGSFFRPVSRDTGKTGSGPRPYFVLADEVHELPDRKILEMLERGFKFRRQPLLFMITNSGSDRNSVAWEEHEHAVKVAAGNVDAVTDPTFLGNVIDDTTFSYVCALDEGDDPLNDPSCWAKANPLLGVTITEEYLTEVVAQAKAIPGQLNGILRLHFCVWTDAETAWMTRATLEPCLADFDPLEHKGKKVSLGLDLSQVRDITALGAVVQTGTVPITVIRDGQKVVMEKPTYDAWVEAWTPGSTIQARELRDKLPYAVWVKQGHLHGPPGESINHLHLAQTLVEYNQNYDVQMVAYDRYAFKRFEEDCTELGLTSLEFVEHPQGGLKKGKPTKSMEEAAKRAGKEPQGLWMPGSVALLEEALLEGRIRLKRNPVLVSAMMSAVAEEDKWGNHWLSKLKSVNKIDCAVALAMALGAANGAAPAKPKLTMFMLG